MVNPSKHDQKAVFQFLGVERCHPAEIRRHMFFVHCAACVPKTGTLDWFHIFLTARQQMTVMPRPQQAGIVTTSENCMHWEFKLQVPAGKVMLTVSFDFGGPCL